MLSLRLFRIGFLPVTVIDVLDIAAVTFIFYQVYKLVRGTRAAHMLLGLLVLLVASLVARWLQMAGVSWLLAQLRTVWVIGLIIVFQPELRRLLINLSQSRVIRLFSHMERSRTVDEIVKAAETLSSRGHGALVVLARNVGIGTVVETGTRLDAALSSKLLASIFVPHSPLHDNAVVIQGHRIVAAGCLLPLSQDPNLPATLGTRHRAAIGMSEESDAVVLIVSEETQEISLAVSGEIKLGLSPPELGRYLEELVDGAAQNLSDVQAA
jgi:diadenylate cyclase